MRELPNGGTWHNPGEGHEKNTKKDIDYIRKKFEDAKTRKNGVMGEKIEYGKGKPFYSSVVDSNNRYESDRNPGKNSKFKVEKL